MKKLISILALCSIFLSATLSAQTLIDYTRKINEELTRKRQEFNLPVAEDQLGDNYE